MKFGQRGIAIISPGAKIIAYAVIMVHPPYPLLVVMYIIGGFGEGLQDAAWNAWIGNMADANQVLGFLHGLFGLGATLSPFIATAMITKAHLPWYNFYYVMVCITCILTKLVFGRTSPSIHEIRLITLPSHHSSVLQCSNS